MTHSAQTFKLMQKVGEFIYSCCNFIPLVLIIFILLPYPFPNNAGIYSSIYIKLSESSHVFAHKFTIFLILAMFYTYFKLLKYLHPLLRALISATLVICSVNLYDSIWSINSVLMRHDGVVILPVASLFLTSEILIILNRYHDFLSFKHFFSVLAVYITAISIAFYGMAATNFWPDMATWDAGNRLIDPNISPYWLLGKFATMTVFVFFISRARKYEAPHILDSRIVS